MPTKFCIIPSCDSIISPRSRLDICPTCRNGLGYWNKKTQPQRTERTRKLTMYTGRLETFVDASEVAALVRKLKAKHVIEKAKEKHAKE